MSSTITICDTCRAPGTLPDLDGPRDGAKLADLVEAAAEKAGVPTRRVSCLMGCEHGCNVAVQAPGKLTYVMGTFTPDAEAADAIVDYARLHGESDSGVVPYRTWPQGVKGHFRARIPALDTGSDTP
ncbi:DUF1636 family protein [Oceanomicrobium pacificus]|uniref:DUF1636 domain-containing protein n=1 Tax=Oceanomicrobium pacificus TaxID=2692916 RepID=A0A6B0TRR0_9RHOB|nr:DUF1636 domain-containing protein [Oceanomicrobium pacificus]MXU64044.1 DUF1636 domain-containing protein [Oceanomicrobium pacificus]